MRIYRYQSEIVKLIGYCLLIIIWRYFSVSLLQEQWNPLLWTKWGLAYFLLSTAGAIFYKMYDDIKVKLNSEIGEANHSIDALIDKLDHANSGLIELNNKTRAELKKYKNT